VDDETEPVETVKVTVTTALSNHGPDGQENDLERPAGRHFSPSQPSTQVEGSSTLRRSYVMRVMTWRPGLLLPIGLLMLTGSFANGHPALAQTSEVCPSGSRGFAQDPEVTAQDVDNGASSMKDFVLAVKERALVSSGISFGCVTRQKGSPWHSDSTYLMLLTPEGRIYLHAKDMSLSGRQLKPSIYQTVLAALSIDQGDGANLRAAVAAAARRGDGGSFTVPGALVNGVSSRAAHTGGLFAVRGASASAYVTAYMAPGFGTPFVLIGGFDLDASHLISLADERIDYGNPSVTAADVVDRDTLKAFVTEAGELYRQTLEAGVGREDGTKLRLAMRDPNGPWRHGSVYLYIWDLTNQVILLHAGFPNTYEAQPLRPVARDVVTGELILPQLIEAAESGPEGGFVEYHFDDPNDDFDSADIPKVGYVREFVAEIPRPDGRVIAAPLVFGSGFYPRSTQASQSTVAAAVLPQVMRSVTASAVEAVSSRIERAASHRSPAAAFSLGGASTLSGAFQANGQALADGTFDLDRLLATSPFTLPLNLVDNGGGGGQPSPLGQFTLWGGGDHRSISGGTPQSVDYDGSVTSANLGIDTRLGSDVLAGAALLWARGTVDDTSSSASGEVKTRLLSVNPYVGWQMPGGMNLWSMAGYGSGTVEVEDAAAGSQESDLTQQMFAAGVNGTLASSDQLITGGVTRLNVKGEVAFTWADVGGAGTIENMELQVGRQRLMVEGAHVRKLNSGATVTSSLEVGVRNDTGDGETGAGAEMGGALRYEDGASRLTVEGRVRTLLSHSGDSEETGVSALVRIAPGAAGHGLAVAVEPSWGRTASGVQQLWDNGIRAGASGDNQARLKAEVGYGFDAPLGLGVVTPYTVLGLTGEGGGSWRMGARWQVAGGSSVSLEGARHEAARDDGPQYGLILNGAVRW